MKFLLSILVLINQVNAAPEGQCMASDQNNKQLMEKCEEFDESKKSCNDQKNCFWLNFNEPITTCKAIDKSDDEFCEEFDMDESKCKSNDRKCTWHNLGKPQTECLPITGDKVHPSFSEHYKYCRTFDSQELDCEKKTEGKCRFNVTIPKLGK